MADTTSGSPIRRSYSLRLKNQPQKEYNYQNYLKKAISVVQCNKTKQSSTKKELEALQRITRVREAATNKKYNDIFSAVVENAFSMDVSNDSMEVVTLDDDEEDVEAILISSRKNSEGDTSGSASETDYDDDDIQVVREYLQNSKGLSTGCGCGRSFSTHEECHKHIIREHTEEELMLPCKDCGQHYEQIYGNHVCTVCGDFYLNLEEHIVTHYRNCTAKSAVMECRFCTKQFFKLQEVMAHEQEKHLTKNFKKQTASYKCNECHAAFCNQDTLSVHYSNHLDLHVLGLKIAELQYLVRAEKEECPFCRMHLSSRKTFRAHLLKLHYRSCKIIDRTLLDLQPIKDQTAQSRQQEGKKSEVELAEKQEAEVVEKPEVEVIDDDSDIEIIEVEVKKEVKEEVADDGF